MGTFSMQQLVITGATGYIGRRLVQLAASQRVTITVLGRTAVPWNEKIRFVRWELGEPLPVLDLPSEYTAVLHLAHDWRDRRTDGINARGTRSLLMSSRARGIKRFVFVSSQSARNDALNAYGRIKNEIESSVDGPDTVSVRVGLVYGGSRRGIYGLLTRLVSVSPLLPVVDPNRLVQPIHIEEVCRGLLAVSDSELTGWIGLAGPEPVRFGEFLKALAQEGFGSSLFVLPIPRQIALLAVTVCRIISFGIIDNERLLGLMGTRTISTHHLSFLGISVRRFRQGLRSDPIGAKALLLEGYILCCFVLGKRRVRGSLLRQYVRATRALDSDPGPLSLPRLVKWQPVLLRFIEPFGATSKLGKRLRTATALSAVSIDAGEAANVSSRFVEFLTILAIVFVEIIAIPCRLLLARRRR
jgi:nucleoside-diphosphate-sugar epimerase